jgi:hypothetical protein
MNLRAAHLAKTVGLLAHSPLIARLDWFVSE